MDGKLPKDLMEDSYPDPVTPHPDDMENPSAGGLSVKPGQVSQSLEPPPREQE